MMILPFRFTLPLNFAPAAADLCKELAGPKAYVDPQQVVIAAPLSSAWLVHQELVDRGWPVVCKAPWSAQTPAFGGDPWAEPDVVYGRDQVQRMVDVGILKDFIPEWGTSLMAGLAPYQASLVGWTAARPYFLAIWGCGAGKTFGGLLAVLHRVFQLQQQRRSPGPVVVVAPAKARRVWRRQPAQYANLRPHVLLPPSERRKGYQDTSDYLVECRDTRTVPLIMVGLESLADHWREIAATQPSVVLFDELHLLRDRKRWEQVPGDDGQRVLSLRDNRSAAAYQLATLPSIRLRGGLSATPLGTGRPRSLYAQLTLLDPGSLGKYWDYAARYCGAHQHEMGFMDDSGATAVEELALRTSFYRHEVTHRDSHGALPPLRWEVVKLEPSELGRAVGKRDLMREIKATEADAKVELGIALCASQKMPVALADLLEMLQDGQKIVSFLPRRSLCERYGNLVSDKLTGPLEKVPLFVGHGGHSQTARDQMLEDFIAAPGAAVLVGTGEAWGTSVDGLNCAHFAQILMLPWTPELFEQWRGRFDRRGLNRDTGTLIRIYVGPSGTIDSRILSRLEEEIGVIEQFMRAEALEGAALRIRGRDDQEAFRRRMIAWALDAETDSADLPEG